MRPWCQGKPHLNAPVLPDRQGTTCVLLGLSLTHLRPSLHPDLHVIGLRSYGTVKNYYIKLRPGLREFLQEASKLFVLSINTHGLREYADAVAWLLEKHCGSGDPEKRTLFGSRVVARCASLLQLVRACCMLTLWCWLAVTQE